MVLPLAACPDASNDLGAWVAFAGVVLVYFGLVVIAVRGAPPDARLRVAATWLLSGAAVTAFAWFLADSGTEIETVLLVVFVVAALMTLVGLGLRKSERAWTHILAGSIGGITPVALLVAWFALAFATDACLWS